jgi:hypothetical protein
MASPTSQSYAIYRPDVWCPKIDDVFRARLVSSKIFTDYSDYVTEGGKTIIIPLGAAYTAHAITTTTGEITGSLITDTGTRLDINAWYGTERVFADYQIAQVATNYRQKEIFATNMAFALAKQFDSAVMALITSTYPSRSVNASTAGLKSSDLESAMGIMESYNVPKEECAFIFHPKAYFNEVLAVQKYYDASIFGTPTALKTGSQGNLYSVPVFITSQIPASQASLEGGAHRNVFIHQRAIGFAFGNLPMTGDAYAVPSGVRMGTLPAEAHRQTYFADIMYGVKTIGGSYRGVRLISKN